MSLLRTRSIEVGSMLAFTGLDPEHGGTYLWGNSADFNLARGDVVQVLEIEHRHGTSWAKVLVAVVKGKCAGRVGHISLDWASRLQRGWQTLTPSGSMAPVRVSRSGSHPKHQDGRREERTTSPDKMIA